VNLLTLSVKDIMRRKGKSLYLLTAMLIPVVILSTILMTVENADNSLSILASKFGFTMIVQPKNIKVERIDQIGVVIDEYLPETVIESIGGIIRSRIKKAQEEIIIAPRIYQRTDGLIRTSSPKTVSTVVAGIDFQSERTAKPSWKLSSGQWPTGNGETVIGGTFARTNNLSENEVISVDGRDFTVTGILENYNVSEDYMMFVPFRVLQDISGKNGFVSLVNVQNVSLDRDRNLLKDVVAELNNSIPNVKALAPQQFSTMKYVLLKKTFKFLLSIVAATVFISIFAIFNIVTSVLYSRIREFGLLKSVGASRRQMLFVILGEYSVMGLAAGIVGYPIGMAITYVLDSFILNLGAGVHISLMTLLAAIASGIICSLAAGFYPTYKLSGITISDSFRTQWEV
jgi:putative ABC transport system permease protein